MMKSKILFLTIALVFTVGRAVSQNGVLNQNDLNYLNKGYWELAKNGYEPRKDLVLYTTYSKKNTTSEWYFICNKICKDSVYVGYMLTGKPNANSPEIYNMLFINRPYDFVNSHNEAVLNKLAPTWSSPVTSTKIFLYRASTVNLYNLNGKCSQY